MPRYRVTIRYGAERPNYEVFDLEAESLSAALSAAAEALPPEISMAADLAEVRLWEEGGEREYTIFG